MSTDEGWSFGTSFNHMCRLLRSKVRLRNGSAGRSMGTLGGFEIVVRGKNAEFRTEAPGVFVARREGDE